MIAKIGEKMTLPMQKRREIVFLLLFAQSASKSSFADPTALIMHQLKVSKKHVYEAFSILQKIEPHLDEIDALIDSHSTEYEFSRITQVEKMILRLALYEMLFEQLDVKIVVTEALRLGKKFSTQESSKYIHAIIDAINQKNAHAASV